MKPLDCLRANWPAPAGVQALTTFRYGAGDSLPPFDCFNLGNFHGAVLDQRLDLAPIT